MLVEGIIGREVVSVGVSWLLVGRAEVVDGGSSAGEDEVVELDTAGSGM